MRNLAGWEVAFRSFLPNRRAHRAIKFIRQVTWRVLEFESAKAKLVDIIVHDICMPGVVHDTRLPATLTKWQLSEFYDAIVFLLFAFYGLVIVCAKISISLHGRWKYMGRNPLWWVEEPGSSWHPFELAVLIWFLNHVVAWSSNSTWWLVKFFEWS